jgi:mRNA interferase MazF
MKIAGQIVLTPFPFTNLTGAKLRPVLLLKKSSNFHDDWLVCMVSSQTHQVQQDLDEIINETEVDFSASGLKVTSILRLSRLAVLSSELMVGSIGQISDSRLSEVKNRLSRWISEE